MPGLHCTQQGCRMALLLQSAFVSLHPGLSKASNIINFALDTVQDLLIKLGIKPCMHLLEIGIFALYHVIVRPIKIMNRTN